MISRSIPDHATMRQLVNMLSMKAVEKKEESHIVDIGCSTGLATQKLVEMLDERATFTLLEISPDMIAKCKERYKGCETVNVKRCDISKEYSEKDVDLLLSIFTIQFTPVAERMELMKKLYDSIVDGGTLILCEKVLRDNELTDSAFTDAYYDIKRINGYSEENIQSKKEALRTALFPLKSEWNIELLKGAGFSIVDCFWRTLNFCGYIAIK